MLHIKNHKQGHLFDPWEHLGPKRRERINSSWAGVFREHILLALPVDSFARCFKTGTGRPTRELYMSLGALILQQMHDFTDEEKEQGKLIDRYFTQKAISCFSLVKPSASEKTLAVVSRDLLVFQISSYRRRERLAPAPAATSRFGPRFATVCLGFDRQTAWRVPAGVGMDAIETVRSRGGCRSFMSQGGLPTYAR